MVKSRLTEIIKLYNINLMLLVIDLTFSNLIFDLKYALLNRHQMSKSTKR